MKKIGLLLGCFNPVHNGHIELAKRVLQSKSIDEIWFVPSLTNLNPKDTNLISAEIRIEMLKKAIEMEPNMEICSIETTAIQQPYTFETLRYLREQYGHDFYPIIATDNLKTFNQWKNYDEILNKHFLIVAKRGDEDLDTIISADEALQQFKEKIIVIDGDAKYEISSTTIRNNIQDEERMSRYLNPEVYKYIKTNQLYGGVKIMSKFNPEKEVDKIRNFVINYMQKNDLDGIVMGISGGKDSSIASALFANILGAENVIGITLPCHSITSDTLDAKEIAKLLGYKLYEIDITDTYDVMTSALDSNLDISDKNTLLDAQINIKPRLRMAALYYAAQSLSAKNNKRYVVAGTGNKCEIYVGYYTKFGDGASDINILANYTVSEILAIGTYLGLPNHLVYKTPSDGISGKSDEEKLGVTYQQIEDHIEGSRYNPLIEKMYENSEHKRQGVITITDEETKKTF